MLDLITAMEIWRKAPKSKRVSLLASKDISACRSKLIQQILREEAFMNRSGSNTELASQIIKSPSLSGNLHIPELAKQARKEAGYILLNHDQSLIDYGFWEEVDIPTVEINLERMGDNALKKGVHAIHCHTGSGKTSNVLLPLARKVPTTDRALIVVPNVDTAKVIAKKLGWAHYHSQGTSYEDIEQAFKSFSRIVTCAASVRHVGEDFTPYNWIFIDEATEIMSYVEKEKNGKKEEAHFHQSLLKLYEIANWADRTYWFSADMTTAYTKRVLQVLAKESQRQAFYYRTLEGYAQFHNYTQLANIQELYVHCSRLLADNKSVYFYTNASPRKGETQKIADVIKSMSPHATVELLDRNVMQSPKGKEIEEEGIENYIVRRKLEEEVYCLVCSPVLQSQYSIVFEDENDAFDECLGWIKYAEICSPDGAAQGLDRMRQTKARTLVLEEYMKGQHSTYKDAWRKTYPKELDQDAALPYERVYWENKVRQEQYKRANLASRQWLFEIKCGLKGAKHSYAESFKISKKEHEMLNEALHNADHKAETRLQWFPENEHTERLRKLNTCLSLDTETNQWASIPKDQTDFTAIDEAQEFTRETAERIFDICLMEPEEREYVDSSWAELYYLICGDIFERTLFDLISATHLQKQMNFFQWFLEGDTTTYFRMNESSDLLKKRITDNWDLVRRTLGLERGQYGTVAGFMQVIGNHIGLTIKPNISARNAKKREWNVQLFQQWERDIPGALAGKKAAEKYAVIESRLLQKLDAGLCDFSEYDKRFLDCIDGVWKAEKKQTVSIDVHTAYTLFAKKMQGPDDFPRFPTSCNGVAFAVRPPQSSIDETIEQKILEEKS